MINSNCFATLGIASNRSKKNFYFSKAGDNRHRGKKSTVRGVAMNPVDHPHGGDTSGGRCSSTPWGKLTKGATTRSVKKLHKFAIITVQQLKREKK